VHRLSPGWHPFYASEAVGIWNCNPTLKPGLQGGLLFDFMAISV
jgi:hypothetical protein